MATCSCLLELVDELPSVQCLLQVKAVEGCVGRKRELLLRCQSQQPIAGLDICSRTTATTTTQTDRSGEAVEAVSYFISCSYRLGTAQQGWSPPARWRRQE